jgi:TPR repeat protein
MPTSHMIRRLATCTLSALLASAGLAADKAKEGMVTRQDLEIVDCLLPGQVRSVGGTTYLTSRRPIRTTTSDCRIRGGEYVAYDRADYKSALRVWMEQANLGDPAAMTNVGEIYERGIGGQPNFEAAIIWYQKVIDDKKIAEKDKSRALFNLGTLYEQGQGVEKDQLRALNLYRQAWGVPDNNLMYTSARDKEVGTLRQELQQAISEKDTQIEVMNKQIKELQKKSSGDAATLQQLVDKLAAERAQSQQKLQSMPPALASGPTPITRKPSGEQITSTTVP